MSERTGRDGVGVGHVAAGAGPESSVPADLPIVVLLGGPSAEHDVSVVSGTAVAEALAATGRPVVQVLIDLGGRWWWLPAGHRRDGRPAAHYDDPAAIGAEGPYDVGAALDRLASASPQPVVFVALHGPFGEDGTVQALLEAAGLPYTGAGVAASAVGMDKALFKRLALSVGIPVVPWREVAASRWRDTPDAVLAELAAFSEALGDPRLMVKPASLGSSVGMTLVHGAGERAAALDEALRHDSVALVERYLAGARELEVAVIGNDPDALEAYGPGEVFPGREFYDYVAKYSPGVSRTSTHADLDQALAARVRDLACQAYRVGRVEGFARVDFLFAGGELFLSEINTIPGFTPISLFPSLPAAAGLDFTTVALRIVGLALARQAGSPARSLTPGDLPR